MITSGELGCCSVLSTVSKLRCGDHGNAIVVVFSGGAMLAGLFIGGVSLGMLFCVCH